MQVIDDDKNPNRSGDSFHLICIHSGWHILANGYLCSVTDEEEGQRVLAAFRTLSPRNHASIDKV